MVCEFLIFKIFKYKSFCLGTIGPPATVPNGNIINIEENHANSIEEPLPAGWEMRFDTFGRRYYVDHNTR